MEKPLKGDYLVSIVTGHKRKRISVFINPSGTADSVDIVIRTCRHIVIDDVGNTQDIDTAGGDIGRHQDMKSAVPKAIQSGLASVL